MTKTDEKTQLDKFKGAAREVRTDDSEERFDRMLKNELQEPLQQRSRNPLNDASVVTQLRNRLGKALFLESV